MFLGFDISEKIMFNFFLVLTYFIIFVGIIFVLFIIYKTIKAKRQQKWTQTQNYKLLLISVPKDNEKSPLAAEQMFASLHGIHKTIVELQAENAIQEHLSFEIVSVDKYIRFYIYVPAALKEFVEGQVYAQYPTVEIQEIEDYTKSVEEQNLVSASTELSLTKEDYFPIKTFPNFEVDPLAGITGALTEIAPGGQIWIQTLARPVSDNWQANGIAYVEAVKSGRDSDGSLLKQIGKGALKLPGELANTFLHPEPVNGPAKKVEEKPELPAPISAGLEGIEEKVTKLGFETKIKIFVWAKDAVSARAKLHTTVGAFKQFNTTNLNGFASGTVKISDKSQLEKYKARIFPESKYIFNIEELASIFHLPSISVETPNIVWAGSKKGESPANLPIKGSAPVTDLTLFAKTDFRNAATKFGIKTDDRRRHIYTIGKTGTGKTTMLENMVITDIREGKGVAVVDPHGDFVDRILDFIPTERLKDVVLFNPSDVENPVGFNLLENVDPELKGIVTSGLVGIFQKIWAFTWGPRLEHILRNTILALLDYPDSTMLGILKMLSDDNFRKKVMEKVKDPVVRDFWLTEFEGYNDRLRSEAVAPIQNKVGQFVSSKTIRNIIGQPKSSFNMQDIMDNKKILLINLAKGKIGEDNSALLGAMMITKIQLTSMSRSYIPEEERIDFYLYVDEFQNFATESFATIFSEARKYKLNIIVANQYITQMPEEVREAVFGNVGTIISFRVGAADAPFLAKEYMPVFEENDLVNLDKYHIYTKMAIDGVTSPAFSAITLPPPTDTEGNREKVVAYSQEKYGRNREEVEQAIAKWSEESSKPPTGEIREGKHWEKPQESFQERPAEKEKTAQKGPSAIIRVAGKKFAEYTDQQGDKWYQEILEPAKTEIEKTAEPEKPAEKSDFPKPPDFSKFKTNGSGPKT